MTKFIPVLFVACGFHTAVFAQENSPYSRYGLGDITPNRNVFARGMGGVSAANIDYTSVNFVNPATLASVPLTIFDIGGEIDVRTLKSANPVKKFSTTNTIFSYLQLAFPLTTEKMRKKDIAWGMNFGLKPVTKINYKIGVPGRTSIDSLYTLYEGTGGANQAFIGTGLKIKKLSFGISAGYLFGNKDYSTRKMFVNDTVIYKKSNTEKKGTFGGLLITGGLQYDIVLNKDKKKEYPKILRLGVYGNLQQQINVTTDALNETFEYDANLSTYRIDSVYEKNDVKGKIEYPSSFGAGFTYQDEHWVFGADYEMTSWSKYSYPGEADPVQNSWVIRAGGQYYPAKIGTPVKKYFNFVKYRAGFYYGPDYIKTGSNRPDYAFTLGTGMPLTSLKYLNYSGEYVTLNTALEVGGRGDKKTNLKENTIRFSIGVSMNARWFAKRKYN
ncbi:hypothetical protein [Ferruginibacter sp.]|nr:hypothetical protein [Ferruginibacter sp.]